MGFKKLFPPKNRLLYGIFIPQKHSLKKWQRASDKFSINDIVNVSVGIDEIEKLVKKSESVIIYEETFIPKCNKILKLC